MKIATFQPLSYRVCLQGDQLVAKTAVSYKWCASMSAYRFSLTLSWFGCMEGTMEQLLPGLWALAVCCSSLWVGTHSSVLSSPIAALQYCNKKARPHGPRRSGPTAPVGWAQNAISAADVFKDLVVQKLQSLTWLFLIVRLFNVAVFFFYFWGELILSFNHTYLIAAIGATLNGPCLSSATVMIMRLCSCWAVQSDE